MQAKYHFLGALPRIDGDNNRRVLGSGVAEARDRGARRLAGPARPEAAAAADPHHAGGGPAPRSRPPRRCCSASTSERCAPVGLDLDRDPHLLIFGNGQSGKSTLLRTYMSEVTRLLHTGEAQLFVVDYRRANLGEFPDEWVADYATNAPDRGRAGRGPRPSSCATGCPAATSRRSSCATGRGGRARRPSSSSTTTSWSPPARATRSTRWSRCSPRPWTSACTSRSPAAPVARHGRCTTGARRRCATSPTRPPAVRQPRRGGAHRAHQGLAAAARPRARRVARAR